MLGMLVTVRRGIENQTESTIIALNEFKEHPHLQFFVWFGFLCPSYHRSLHLRKKNKIQGLGKM